MSSAFVFLVLQNMCRIKSIIRVDLLLTSKIQKEMFFGPV